MTEMTEDIADTMIRIAMDAMRNSYVDHDGIAAGACVLTSDGTLYLWGNSNLADIKLRKQWYGRLLTVNANLTA